MSAVLERTTFSTPRVLDYFIGALAYRSSSFWMGPYSHRDEEIGQDQ